MTGVLDGVEVPYVYTLSTLVSLSTNFFLTFYFL
jgi:hypothetical protein